MIYLIMDEAKYLHTLQFAYCSPGGLAMKEEACCPWGVDELCWPGERVQPSTAV